MRLILFGMVAAALGPATVLSTVPAAEAHDWYPLACCSGIDCGPVDASVIEFTPNGWLVVPTREIIGFEKAQVSPDGRYHRCTMKAHDPLSKTRCLFVPSQGS